MRVRVKNADMSYSIFGFQTLHFSCLRQFLPVNIPFGIDLGSYQAADSRSATYWLQQKYRRGGNNDIILHLLSEIPWENSILILIPERFHRLYRIDRREKAEKNP